MKLQSKSFVYKIVRTISEETSSCVYAAYRKHKNYPLSQRVLLKLFKPRGSRYSLELESFLKIESPYFVKILNFEMIEKKEALILEWIDGINLLELLRSPFFLSKDEVSYICHSIQQGLLDLQKIKLCHGDLSLSNVLIDREGRIKMIDFGKGNYMGEGVFSTPYFTAPEILKGESPSFFSDLFSLGVLEKTLLKGWCEIKNQNHTILRDSLLDPAPQKRKIKKFKYNQEAILLLSMKVKQVLKNKKNEIKTKSIYKKDRSKKSLKIFYLGFMLCALISIGLHQKNPYGSISVRSHQWFHIQIAGQQGFTPFTMALPSGTHTLFWKNKEQKGSLLVTIKSGEHLLLTKKDLISRKL